LRHWAHRQHSQIFRSKPCVLGNAREHSWTKFLAVVEREHEVRPAFARQCLVRPGLALDPG
jgi:hypothetical protein